MYRYDGTRFRLMAAAEGLPCATEVHALHVAADGALWANTCARIFRFRRAALSLHRRAERHVVRRARHGEWRGRAHSGGDSFRLVRGHAERRGSYSARPYPLGPELAGTPCAESRGTVPQLWFGCGRRLCVEDRGRVSMFGPAEGLPDDCLGRDRHHARRFRVDAQPGQAVPKAARRSADGSRKTGHRIQHLLGRADDSAGTDRSWSRPTRGWPSAAMAPGE